jgi:hypothetical protein
MIDDSPGGKIERILCIRLFRGTLIGSEPNPELPVFVSRTIELVRSFVNSVFVSQRIETPDEFLVSATL